MKKEILQQILDFLGKNPLVVAFILLLLVFLVVALSKSKNKIENMNNFGDGPQVGIRGIWNVGQRKRNRKDDK